MRTCVRAVFFVDASRLLRQRHRRRLVSHSPSVSVVRDGQKLTEKLLTKSLTMYTILVNSN